jgi:hypothetical protein
VVPCEHVRRDDMGVCRADHGYERLVWASVDGRHVTTGNGHPLAVRPITCPVLCWAVRRNGSFPRAAHAKAKALGTGDSSL